MAGSGADVSSYGCSVISALYSDGRYADSFMSGHLFYARDCYQMTWSFGVEGAFGDGYIGRRE